jgi:7-cyano-7-deazaguanine synthase
MRRAYVLLSGGVDSSTCLAIARDQFDEVEAISIDYGQRHAKEVAAAYRVASHYPIHHRVLDLGHLIPKSMLTDPSREIPNKSYADIEGVSPTYVPFRNGLMLSALASLAQGEWVAVNGKDNDLMLGLQEWAIFFGAHKDDAAGDAYPDCTPEFIGSMAAAIHRGTYGAIRLHAPLEWMGKADIIQKGTKLGVPWHMTWSCYAGGDIHCGTCPTCRARKQGFRDAHIDDPTEYAA